MAQPTFREKAINEGLITALAVGGFLIILGVVFGLTSGMPQKVTDFFTDITATTFPAVNGNIILPAPAHPAAHLEVYGAALNFMVGIAVLQVAILATRLFMHSKIKRIAETVGNMVFWFGAAIVTYVYLLKGTLNGWFIFWAGLVIIVGVSLVVRGITHFSMARKRSDRPCC
jgi:hypothetical protein